MDGFVYRALSTRDPPSAHGLQPPSPGARTTANDAIVSNSPSGYVQTTRDLEVALYFAFWWHGRESRHEIAVVSLEGIEPKRIKKCYQGEAIRGRGETYDKALNFARKQQIVLIEGAVPASSVKSVIPTGHLRGRIPGPLGRAKPLDQFRNGLPEDVRNEVEKWIEEFPPLNEAPTPLDPSFLEALGITVGPLYALPHGDAARGSLDPVGRHLMLPQHGTPGRVGVAEPDGARRGGRGEVMTYFPGAAAAQQAHPRST